ncbi:MAG: hypothetical protein KC431_25355 [Myxococcales bacterium]|nr:hypothetical protein [Myxococcales bacterium]
MSRALLLTLSMLPLALAGCTADAEAIAVAEATARHVDCDEDVHESAEPSADETAPPAEIISGTWGTNYQIGVQVCGKPVVYDVVCWPHCKVTHAHVFEEPQADEPENAPQ